MRIVSQQQLQEGYYELFQESPNHPPIIYNRKFRVIREIPHSTPGGPLYEVENPTKDSP